MMKWVFFVDIQKVPDVFASKFSVSGAEIGATLRL
jgi:hypothetical protein